jgi:hypothetical protein
MINLAQKLPSGFVGCEVVGCRAAEHREKANGIDEARREGWPVGNTCSHAHQYGRADHTAEDAYHLYDSVCCELARSILHGPNCSTHRNQPSREFRCLLGLQVKPKNHDEVRQVMRAAVTHIVAR